MEKIVLICVGPSHGCDTPALGSQMSECSACGTIVWFDPRMVDKIEAEEGIAPILMCITCVPPQNLTEAAMGILRSLAMLSEIQKENQ